MVSDLVLQTKLHPPTLAATTVVRPRLLRRLQQGTKTRLTLIAAPAGFGKTTLVATYLAQLGTESSKPGGQEAQPRLGWIALDRSDNDFARFLHYLLATLQQIAPHCGVQTAALLAAPQSTPPEILLTLLLNDLALLTTPVLVLLDDYHLIETPAIHEAMTLLIEQLPAMVHFVILSRTDPPLPLARWRVRGYLCEIRAADLRFTASEIAQFFATSMARPLSPAALQLLRERTEGWIAALQLAALSLQHQDDVDHFLASFGGSQRHLVDYLVDEVFRLQPPPIQAFLLATAVLDRFCADLCRAVLHKGVGADSDSDGDGKDKGKGSDQSREDTQALLETLERSNLFLIPLDGERRWYRYHALFAEFLRHRLGGEAAIYHRRAADWYKAAGFVEESIDHLLAAADLDAAAAEIAVHGLSFTLRHQLSTVERWLTQLPTPMRQQQLGLVLCELWLVLGSGNLIAMEEALARAERVATARERDAVPPSPEQLGEYAAAHALVASFRQDHATTIRSARQALDRLPPSAAQLRITVSSGLGYGYYCAGDLRRAESTLRNALQLSRPEYVVTHVTLLGMLAMAIELQGRMAEAVTLYRAILAQAQFEEVTEQQSKPRYLPNPSVLLALHGLALRLYEFNQLDEATALLAQAVTLSTAAGNQMIQGHALATQALVHQARGDFATADELLTRAAAILEPLAVSSYSLVNAQQIFLWCTMGKMNAALAWADQFTATHPARPQPITAFETAYFALARVLLHNGQFAQASALLTDLEAQANVGNYHYYVLWAKLLQAVRLAAAGETPRAEEALIVALQWAAPAGYIRSFVDEGAVVQTLLTTIRTKQAKSDPTLLTYVDRLLAAFPTGATEPPTPSSTVTRQTAPPAPLIEPLTEREIEVLRLVARGLSNRAMAQELTVALSTVKKHLVHIYGKLGVSSRTQALIRADELGLLP